GTTNASAPRRKLIPLRSTNLTEWAATVCYAECKTQQDTVRSWDTHPMFLLAPKARLLTQLVIMNDLRQSCSPATRNPAREFPVFLSIPPRQTTSSRPDSPPDPSGRPKAGTTLGILNRATTAQLAESAAPGDTAGPWLTPLGSPLTAL
ncbi:hypothetical protein FRC09_003209, partial [Ceratobasidium sp. 395]